MPNSSLNTQHSALPLGWHRYTMLAALLIFFVGLLPFTTPTDPDVWWHLRNGQLIWQSGIPHHDVYSFTAEGRVLLLQEWLTEVVMYALQQWFGYLALTILFGILQAAAGVIVYRLLRRSANRVVSLLLLLLYFIYAAPTWGVRPQILAPIFLGGFYLVLLGYKHDPQRSRALWLLPLLTVLWTNLHASYFMGIALVGAFIVGEFANNYLYRPPSPTPLRPLLLILGGCLLATLLNPYLLELWSYPLTYLLNGTSNPLLRYILEWQSPNFHEYSNLLLTLSFILLAIVGIARPVSAAQRASWRVGLRRRVDITEVIILTAFTVLGLQAVYLAPIYGMMVLPLLARGIARTWPLASRRHDEPVEATEGRINVAVGIVLAIVLTLLLTNLPQSQTRATPRTDTSFTFPAAAADYLSKLPNKVRMYNDFGWGGYLIYRLYPQQQVFIDGRADMYREHIFDDFITVQNLAPGWRDLLVRYGVNLVVIQRGSNLEDALRHEPGWRPSYQDDIAIVFQKN